MKRARYNADLIAWWKDVRQARHPQLVSRRALHPPAARTDPCTSAPCAPWKTVPTDNFYSASILLDGGTAVRGETGSVGDGGHAPSHRRYS